MSSNSPSSTVRGAMTGCVFELLEAAAILSRELYSKSYQFLDWVSARISQVMYIEKTGNRRVY